MMRLFCASSALVLSLLLAAQAGADGFKLLVTQEGVGTMTLTDTMLGCGDPVRGIVSCSGENFAPTNPEFTWTLDSWNITFDEDPFINQVFGFTNVGPTATFTLTSVVPILPVVPSSVIGGNSQGSVQDANFDGFGGMGTAGTPFYEALVDGSVVQGLHANLFVPGGPPMNFPGNWGFAGNAGIIPVASFGLPGPSQPSGAALTNIGIRNRFNLAGGDQISSTNFFVIQVPEPSTAALLGLSLAGLALIGRRFSA